VFGDYIGGLLNPIVSAFALYLAAKAYDAQRKDLQETQLAQEKQVKLAALTALLNTKLMQLDSLNSKKLFLLEDIKKHISENTENTKKLSECNLKIIEDEIKPKIKSLESEIDILEGKIKAIGELDK